MWIVCITSVRHVLTVNGYGGRQTKENEKSWCFKGWETLVILYIVFCLTFNVLTPMNTIDIKLLYLCKYMKTIRGCQVLYAKL